MAEDLMLRYHRACLVKKYRANPRLWPDGIDSAGDRWYGDGKAWSTADVEKWSNIKLVEDIYRDELPKGKRRGLPEREAS